MLRFSLVSFCFSRCCRNPMKGATPVPGPIITIGWSGSVGRWNEVLRRQKIGPCMSVCMCVGRLSCLAMLCSIPQISLVCQLKVGLCPHFICTSRYMYQVRMWYCHFLISDLNICNTVHLMWVVWVVTCCNQRWKHWNQILITSTVVLLTGPYPCLHFRVW